MKILIDHQSLPTWTSSPHVMLLFPSHRCMATCELNEEEEVLESVESNTHDSNTVMSLQLECQEIYVLEKGFMRTPSRFL